jgi:hypothetical protein
MSKLKQEDEKEKPKEGLVDGGHVIIKCSNCDKPLVDVLIVKPNEKKSDGTPFVWQCVAECCYCNDKSFITEVKGIFRAAGIIIENKENPEHYTGITNLDDIVIDDDNILFKTSRRK